MSVYGDLLFFVAALVVPLVLGLITVRVLKPRAGGAGKPGWWVLIGGNALILAVILSLIFLGFESYYRFIYDTTDGLNKSKVSRRWYQRHWVLNRQNVRDDSWYPAKRPQDPLPRKRRITFIGDSFTAAQGVLVEDRFVNRIRAERPQWEVHMLARLGLDTERQTFYLKKWLQHGYELDQVVLVYCWNDIGTVILSEIRPLIRFMMREPKAGTFFIDHSFFINILYYRWRQRSALAKTGIDMREKFGEAYTGATWARQKAHMRSMKELIEKAGGHLAVVTFPYLGDELSGDGPPLANMHGALAEFWREEGVPHIDLLPTLQSADGGSLVVNRYDSHPGDYAHELAADAILELLDPLLNEGLPVAKP